MENAGRARGGHDALIESLQLELGIIVDPSTHDIHLARLRVPERIKHLNPDAYKPRLISVGPLHHGQPELQPMEALKRRQAGDVIQYRGADLEELIQVTKNHEVELRDSYGITTQQIPSHEFVKIMITDAVFLLDILKQWRQSYHKRWNDIYSDIFLLENQIPLFYLSKVFAVLKKKDKSIGAMLELCDNFTRRLFSTTLDSLPFRGEKHLLDRLRTTMAYTRNDRPEICCFPCPRISQLHRAGIKFYPSNHEISFKQGILRIPRLKIDHNTRRYFANLLASEWCVDDHCASDYIALMDYFIDGPEDVRLLVQSHILVNHLEDNKAAASLINEIGRSIHHHDYSRYGPILDILNAHCMKRWVIWRSKYLFYWTRELKANYFGNPWKALSVIAAVILLALTFTQTLFSYIQLKESMKKQI